MLALGVGMSRYAKWKTRFHLVRELAAMTPEQRTKVLSRLDPARAMEIRQELMERYRIAA